MKKTLPLLLATIFLLRIGFPPVLIAKPAPKSGLPADSVKLEIDEIKVGPDGIYIKDRHGKIIRISDESELSLQQIDSILEAVKKNNIYIESPDGDVGLPDDSFGFKFEFGDEHGSGDVVRFGHPIFIPKEQIVEGDVVGIGTSLHIEGTV
ncbi:MAG: hypothetical protein L0Y74_07265, partial [candidate division Zixibacteria bacterium]|nr:hypothetical protein [candidate division Zixibacteria bacterium]